MSISSKSSLPAKSRSVPLRRASRPRPSPVAPASPLPPSPHGSPPARLKMVLMVLLVVFVLLVLLFLLVLLVVLLLVVVLMLLMLLFLLVLLVLLVLLTFQMRAPLPLAGRRPSLFMPAGTTWLSPSLLPASDQTSLSSTSPSLAPLNASLASYFPKSAFPLRALEGHNSLSRLRKATTTSPGSGPRPKTALCVPGPPAPVWTASQTSPKRAWSLHPCVDRVPDRPFACLVPLPQYGPRPQSALCVSGPSVPSSALQALSGVW